LANAIFQLFEKVSGLGCNVAKCQMVTICCSQEEVALAHDLFPCPIKDCPMVYLGIPLSTSKMPKSVFQPLVDKMADKLSARKGHLMHRSDRLALIKSTLVAMPVYTMINHALPPWVTKAFVKIFKGFLWVDSEAAHGVKCLVAWDYVQRTLSLGGLGVKNLELMGRALRLRWLWLQHTDPSKTWASSPVHEDEPTRVFFRASATVMVRNSASTLFWEEQLLDGQGLQELASDLLAVVPARRRPRRTVQSALVDNAWLSDVQGPLTVPVIMQYVQVRELVDSFQLMEGDDMVAWRWCASGQFSSSSAYDVMFLGQSTMQGAKQLWKARALLEHKFFLWLAIQDRCWTNGRRFRHGLTDDANCALCLQHDEEINHLLLGCVYSREVWFLMLSKLGYQQLAPVVEEAATSCWL
jgi:hypothetical protein